MKRPIWYPLVLTIIFVLCMSVRGYSEQGYIVQYTKIAEFKQAGPVQTSLIKYYTPRAAKVVEGNISTVMVIKQGRIVMYKINSATKTYTDLSQMSPLVMLMTLVFLECDQQGRCIEKEDFYKPTNIKAKIGQWVATKYRINPSKSSVLGIMFSALKGAEAYQWFSKDPKDLIEANKVNTMFYRNAAKTLASYPDLANYGNTFKLVVDIMERVRRQKGVVVMTEMRLTDPRVPERLHNNKIIFVKATKTNIPESEFQVPEGYREVPLGSE